MKLREILLLVLGLGLLLLLGLSLRPIAPQQAATPALVGFINLRDGRVFSGGIEKYFRQLADANPQLQVEYFNGQDSAEVQCREIHALVEREAKAIIVMATNPVELIPGIQEANDAGIPVITLNNRVFGGTSIYVGSLEYDAGWLQGVYMRLHLPQNARIFYLKGDEDRDNTQQRLRGFADACLMERSDVRVIRCASAKFSREKAQRLVSAWLQTEPQVDGIVAANDEMAEGALEALTAAGRQQNVLVSGIDARESTRQLIREGKLAQSVRQDARGQAQGAYDTLLELLAGREARDVLLPFQSVTQENVDD